MLCGFFAISSEADGVGGVQFQEVVPARDGFSALTVVRQTRKALA